MFMLLTPLEQFQIISLLYFKLFFLDFSFTNLILINVIVLIFFSTVVYFSSSDTNYPGKTRFFFVPNNWQILLETTYDTISQLLFDTINEKKYFSFISVLFTFISFSNLIGLIPYSFTITSRLIVTFTLSLSIFICVNIRSIEQYKDHMLSLFIPANTPFSIALFLVPIEFISYIFKTIYFNYFRDIDLETFFTFLRLLIGPLVMGVVLNQTLFVECSSPPGLWNTFNTSPPTTTPQEARLPAFCTKINLTSGDLSYYQMPEPRNLAPATVTEITVSQLKEREFISKENLPQSGE